MIITLLQWYLAIGIIFAIIMHITVTSKSFREWHEQEGYDNSELPTTFTEHCLHAVGDILLWPYLIFVNFIKRGE